MALAKAEKDSETTPVRNARRSPGKGIWDNAVTIIGIATLGLVAAFAVVGWRFVESAGAETATAVNQTYANTLAATFNARTRELRENLEAFAASPIAQSALTSNDGSALVEAGRVLAAMLPDAKRIDIIPKGQAAVDLNAEIPISFAALDVIRRAETQPFVGPEASLNQRNVVYAAVPVTTGGTVSGVLFAAMANRYFMAPLAGFDEALGQVVIEQRFEGSAPSRIFEWGTAGNDKLMKQVDLEAAHWRLQFAPAPDQRLATGSWMDLLTPFALSFALLLGGVMLAFSGLVRKLSADAVTLTDYAGRLVRGRNAGLDRYKLPLFQQIAVSLSQQGNGLTADTDTGEAPAAKPRRIEPTADEAETEADAVADLLGDDQGDSFLEVRKSIPPKDDNFGIEVTEEDAGAFGLALDPDIFRAYDIRGIVEQNLTEDVVYWIGRAFAAEALDRRQTRTAVGYDGRHSSPDLARSLIRGLTEGGLDVADIGQVPTPILYYATHALDTGTGIMITGSHNPPEYNGLKMMIGGETLAEARILRLRQRIENNELSDGAGDIESIDVTDHYVARILDDVALAQPLKVVVDCGNGIAGKVAPRLLSELGCEVIPLYCDVDGDFPNHHPDPADPHTLEDLITVVNAEEADLGLAFDGDGDRLGVITSRGEIIWPDKLMMLFSQDIISRNPGADIIYDVKCSRHLNNLISEYGGRPIMWKTGHSHIKAKMKETGALLGGEFSGHICFGERWYGFDDALYSAARLLEIVAGEGQSADELFAQFPVTFSTPEIKVKTTEAAKFQLVDRIAKDGDFGDGAVTSIDGVRVDYEDGFGLIRASNTSPYLTLRFEADGQGALERIQQQFATALAGVDSTLKFR